MKTTDWTKLYENYKGLWVALDSDDETVVGKGTTAKEALEGAKSKGFAKAGLTFVPREVITLA